MRQHNRWRIQIGWGDIRKHRSIGNAQPVNAMHPRWRINNSTCCIWPHPASAARMKNSAASFSKIINDGSKFLFYLNLLTLTFVSTAWKSSLLIEKYLSIFKSSEDFFDIVTDYKQWCLECMFSRNYTTLSGEQPLPLGEHWIHQPWQSNCIFSPTAWVVLLCRKKHFFRVNKRDLRPPFLSMRN